MNKKDSWITTYLKSLAESRKLSEEQKLDIPHREAQFFYDFPLKLLERAVDLTSNLDEKRNRLWVDAKNLLQSMAIYQVIESAFNPSPTPIFKSIQELPAKIAKKNQDWEKSLEFFETTEAIHYSYASPDGALVRWSVTNNEDGFRRVEFQIGTAATDKPALRDQYTNQTATNIVSDQSYFKDGGTRDVYTLEFGMRYLRPTATKCEHKRFGDRDSNGQVVNPEQALPDWYSDLRQALPKEISGFLN